MLKRAVGENTSFMALPLKAVSRAFALLILACTWPCVGQTVAPSPVPAAAPALTPARTLGTITGTVVDQSGAVIGGAHVKLSRTAPDTGKATGKDSFPSEEVLSGDDGRFTFTNVAAGPFQLAITASGFAPQTSSGTLLPGEIQTVSQISLAVAENVTDVDVSLSRIEIAEAQIKDEEKQRVIGIIPNFYVSYDPNAVPLTSKQKFKLAARTVVDPFTFMVVAGTAGIEQAQNHFYEYGQGVQGYAKRFGANYADTVSGTFIGGAILPALLKQDPRYFYKGTGSLQSRFFYAISMAVVCKGDNGHWQPGYSTILGSLASGGLSNLYYPSADRNSAALTFDNAAVGLASNAIGNLLQEFVIRKLTPHANRHDTTQP